jgi:hypothetical protein
VLCIIVYRLELMREDHHCDILFALVEYCEVYHEARSDFYWLHDITVLADPEFPRSAIPIQDHWNTD